jgi:hypothetical protein
MMFGFSAAFATDSSWQRPDNSKVVETMVNQRLAGGRLNKVIEAFQYVWRPVVALEC